MKRSTLNSIIIGLAIGIPFSAFAANHKSPRVTPEQVSYIEDVRDEAEGAENGVEIASATVYPTEAKEARETAQETPEQVTTEETSPGLFPMTDAESELLAQVVMAEAGNQSDTGKELVADVVLNRVESEDFPDTVTDVIYQKYAFSSVWFGGLEKWGPYTTDSCREAVRRAREKRLYTSILYFTAGGYGKYGTPAFQCGDHYFSTK